MPAHLSLLLLLANPLVGGDALGTSQLAATPLVSGAEQQAAGATPLRAEFEVLRARHEQARRALEQTPGAAQLADQAYGARFIELSERGSARATAWFLRAFPLTDLASRTEVADRLGLYGRLLREEADGHWLLDPEFELFDVLCRDAATLGRDSAVALAEAFARTSTVDETRAAALGAAATMVGTWTEPDPARRAQAQARHADVVARFPDTAQAQTSRTALWRLSRLAVGRAAPDFITRDVDGNEIRLADLHRRVLVVEFWSAEEPGTRARVADLQALAERHIDERFFLLGVNLDADPESFRRSVESLEVEWTNVFEGGLAQRPVWRVDRPGSNLVLDANGVVRFVDVHGTELEAAVASLLGEFRAPGAPAQAPRRAFQGGGNPLAGSRGR